MNILVVDDHLLFREGLVNMLQAQPDLCVVGEGGTVSEAIQKARELKPDLILLDFRLPDGIGPDAARVILADLPHTQIIFLTIHEAESYLLAAVRSGAVGYIVKDIPFSRLVGSIRGLLQNEPAFSGKMVMSLLHEIAHPRIRENNRDANLADLTLRDIDILKDLAIDASNQEIADHLSISVATVKHSLHQIFEKLNLKNRKEVASFARREGLGRQSLHH